MWLRCLRLTLPCLTVRATRSARGVVEAPSAKLGHPSSCPSGPLPRYPLFPKSPNALSEPTPNLWAWEEAVDGLALPDGWLVRFVSDRGDLASPIREIADKREPSWNGYLRRYSASVRHRTYDGHQWESGDFRQLP